jgi:hypothetical protein
MRLQTCSCATYESLRFVSKEYCKWAEFWRPVTFSCGGALLCLKQAPILPPISPSIALPSFIGMPVWNMCSEYPATAHRANAVCSPPPSADTSSKCTSPSNTMPNTPSMSFTQPHQSGHASTPAPLRTLSQNNDADESDQDSSEVTCSDHNNAEGDNDDDCPQDDDKNSPVYTGVSRSGLNGRWRAQLSTRGRTVHLGTFPSAEEAARAWDRAAVQERGKAAVTNFAASDYLNADGSLKTEAGCASQGQGAKGGREDESTSRGYKSFRGVYHSGTYGRWKARIVVKGHKIHLGTFASAEDAARAWDLKALEYRGRGTVTNFDSSLYTSGKVSAPRKVEEKDSDDDDEHERNHCGYKTSHGHAHSSTTKNNRKRSIRITTSPSPSDLSDLCTPRAPASPPSASKRGKHSHPKEVLRGEGAERSERPCSPTGKSESRRSRCEDSMSSLLSLCEAAEAMS